MRRFFTGLYGNETVKTRLGAAITAGRQTHALLIVGPNGSGKSTFATEIAAALNCENKDSSVTPLPCGKCNTCRRIYEGSYTDIKWLRRDHQKATIGVDELRAFREDMFLSATESEHKIYVIDDADKMTPNAQNALLKVLEEPPSAVTILLLCEESDKVLTTIKSRAQLIRLSRFSPSEISDYLVKKGLAGAIDEKRLSEDVMSADGRIGRAIEILSAPEAVEADRRVTADIISTLRVGAPYSELYTAVMALPQKRSELTEALDELTLALSDLVKIKFSPSAPLSFFASRSAAAELADKLSPKKLMAAYDAVRDAAEDNLRNASVPAIISCLGAKIKLI